jgi:hypothetical protein
MDKEHDPASQYGGLGGAGGAPASTALLGRRGSAVGDAVRRRRGREVGLVLLVNAKTESAVWDRRAARARVRVTEMSNAVIVAAGK